MNNHIKLGTELFLEMSGANPLTITSNAHNSRGVLPVNFSPLVGTKQCLISPSNNFGKLLLGEAPIYER